MCVCVCVSPSAKKHGHSRLFYFCTLIHILKEKRMKILSTFHASKYIRPDLRYI